jgi:hypothetical protein
MNIDDPATDIGTAAAVGEIDKQTDQAQIPNSIWLFTSSL